MEECVLKPEIIELLTKKELHIATIQISYSSGRVHVSLADQKEVRFKGSEDFDGQNMTNVNEALEEAFRQCLITHEAYVGVMKCLEESMPAEIEQENHEIK